MSKLSDLIKKECTDFVVNIVPSNHEVFVEICHIKSMGFLNMIAATGNEAEALEMLLFEWEYLKITDRLNYSIN